VTEPPLSVSFFDPAHQIYGTARAGATLLFEGTTPAALAEGPSIERQGERLRASLPERFSLDLEPVSEEVDLAGVAVRVCKVHGHAAGKEIDCLGTTAETRTPPAWDELDAIRSISLLVDAENALLAVARRPRAALGHGDELVSAALLQAGELMSIEEARISTVYDQDGRQRSAGLELWLPGEDFPRRGSGKVVAGSSLELEGLLVHAAVFQWRLEEREGIGAYEVMVRNGTPTAA
jgi:hypothetical protein